MHMSAGCGAGFHYLEMKMNMATKKLTAQQAQVLRMACTHGHLTQGCRVQSDYGGRTCTIYSLRRLGLLDVMDTPTDAGRAADKTGRVALKTPNVEVRRGPATEGETK